MIVDLDDSGIVYCNEGCEYYRYNIPIDNFERYNITEQNKIKTVLVPCKNFSGLKCKNCGARHKNGAWRTHRYCYKCGAEFINVKDDFSI